MARPRTILRLLILIAAGALSACGGGSAVEPDGTASPGESATPATGTLHQDVITKVYDPDYSVPSGFFVDERAGTAGGYTAYHVKDSSISFELCTDDYYEALDWESSDNVDRVVNGVFVDAHENEKYFEFVRELQYSSDVGNVQGETTLGFARVFKCSSINRNGVDRNLRDGFGGTLNNQPLTAAAVRDFTEYLWQFEFFTASARKVLDTYTTETDHAIGHTLRIAFPYNQGADRCDRIEVVDWNFSADRATGDISRSFRFLYGLEAERVDSTARQCDT